MIADSQETEIRAGRFGFALVIIYLVLEYLRPQDTISAFGAIRPNWIVIALMLLAWRRTHKSLRSVASPQMSLMLLLVLLLALWVPFATNNYLAYGTLEGFLLLLPFCASCVLFVDTPERLRSFLKWWSFLALCIAAKAISGHGVAGSGFLGDENDVALLVNVMLPFVLCLFAFESKRPLKLLYLGISLLCVAAVVATRSRGGLVGLVAVFSVIWLLSPRKMLTLILVCILGFGVYLTADQQYWARMRTMEATDEGTAKGRLDSWQAGWAMFKDHPLGVGPGNFPIHFPEYQPESMQHNMWGRAAHSLWFTLLPELGIPGAVLYLLLARANLVSLWRLRSLPGDPEMRRLARLLSIAFLASIAGFFTSGSFLSVLFYPHYWYLSAMIVATSRVLTNATAPGRTALPVVPSSA